LIEDFVRSLGLDAYLVGGAVRDELLGLESKDADFLVIGVDAEALRAALAPHGRVEDLVVAGRPVGMRLYPRDPALRKLAPKGIELAPSRREVSTGSGRHDFDIVIDPEATVDEDLERRDFTMNAIARDPSTNELLDPHGGQKDIENGVLRFVGNPFERIAEDGLRVLRALRFMVTKELATREETTTALKSTLAVEMLNKVSVDRIREELEKMLSPRTTMAAIQILSDCPAALQAAIFRGGLWLQPTTKSPT